MTEVTEVSEVTEGWRACVGVAAVALGQGLDGGQRLWRATTVGGAVDVGQGLRGARAWMILQPAASRSATSARIARASWYAVVLRDTSLRANAQLSIVTGPVSMPFTGCSVRRCATWNSRTVIAAGRETSAWMTGGRT